MVGSLAIAWLLSGAAPSAQNIPPKSIKPVLGKSKVYDFKDATAPLTAAGQVYSARQILYGSGCLPTGCQASYLPTGALGNVEKVIRKFAESGPLQTQDSAALPQKSHMEAPLCRSTECDPDRRLSR